MDLTRKIRTHPLKTLPYFYNVVGTLKTFEVRKNDRNFQVGDILWLQEWSEEAQYTGRSKKFTISYILEGGQFGIQEGYCVMSLSPFMTVREDRVEQWAREGEWHE